jgi:TonB family protein
MIQMSRLSQITILLLIFRLTAFGQTAPGGNPAALLNQARELLSPEAGSLSASRLRSDVLPLLQRANSMWETVANRDSQYAESLDLTAILLRSLGEQDLSWRSEAAPLISKALDILESQPRDRAPEDLALTLELEAGVYGYQSLAGGPGAAFWNRAASLRAERVANIERSTRASQPVPAVVPLPPQASVVRIIKPGSVSQPSVIAKVDPLYSPIARIAKYSCTVSFRIIVNARGYAQDLNLVRGCGYGLDENAAEALLHWQFNPGWKDGQPVAVRATIDVNFKLL